MSVDLSAYFEQFIANISLGDPQVPRMNRAARTVADFLQRSYGIPAENVFLQGSYPIGTAVEPIDGGEYDLDIVAVCLGDQISCNAALTDLESRFKADGRFRDRVKPKKPCVRLEYAEDDVGKFHLDVVPVRASPEPDCPLDAPRRNEGWRGTAPAEYTSWCVQQGSYFLRTVKAMKRWRDEQQSVRTAIKSIVLQVLVAQCMPQVANDADRLAGTFRNLYAYLSSLSGPPVVTNPVLQRENLAARWTNESFRSFVSELAEAVEWADKAEGSTDAVEAADAWREILGEDFPLLAPHQLGFQVGDYSHAESPAAMGWQVSVDPRYRVTIYATEQRGRRSQVYHPYPSNGRLIFAGHKLHFRAQVVARNHVDVWWQVANTGGHARDVSGLRGQIFRGKDLRGRPCKDSKDNWEHTAYTGSHLIRALLVHNNTVVAGSDWFTVNIYSKERSFRL
jgi:hypothetical protein